MKFKLIFQNFKKKFKKFEFSKLLAALVIIAVGVIGAYSIFAYYSLVSAAIAAGAAVIPDASLPIACVGTILGALLTYCLYQFGLKNSRNKYKIDGKGVPYIDTMKQLYDEMMQSTKDLEEMGEDEK